MKRGGNWLALIDVDACIYSGIWVGNESGRAECEDVKKSFCTARDVVYALFVLTRDGEGLTSNSVFDICPF